MAESVQITNLDEFKTAYKHYRTTLIDVYYTHVKHTNLNRVNNNLKQIIEASIKSVVPSIKDEDLKTYDFYDVHEFLVLVLYSAYNKTLGIDSDRLTKSSFGYNKCVDTLQSLLQILGKLDTTAGLEALNVLLSIGRDEDYETYISSNHFCDDLLNIKELLDSSKKRIGADSDELNALIGKTFDKNIESALSTIRSRFSYMLEGTFGIDRYKGIYTGKTPAVMQGVSKGTTKIIEPDIEFGTHYKPIFDDILNISLYSDLDGVTTNGRQFDTERIANTYGLNTSHLNVKPIYFPYKMLEFIAKCGVVKGDSFSFTKKTQLLNYTRLPDSIVGTKESYLNAICNYFEDEIIDYIYRCLLIYCGSNFTEKYSVLKGDASIASIEDSVERAKRYKESKQFAEKALIDILENRESDIATSKGGQSIGYDTLVAYILSSLRYYVDCVTTAVILDKCETAVENGFGGSKITKILEFRIKICSRLNAPYANYKNSQFIESLIKVCGLNTSDMADVEEVESVMDENGFSMLDVKYTFNMEKVSARPTFAYKALDALINQQSAEDKDKGIAPVSWQNILLGRNLSDRILTSGKDGDINLQSSQVHWIFSGSRSGKGVMCYNIFATAIGAKIPIFYIDRKPDTATVLSALCPEMFCVNGGQYDPTIDTKGVFAPDTYNFNIPSYLAKDLENSQNRFDFVYFRAIMLVLAMFDYADTYKDSVLGSKLLDAFGGGVLLVLDEFSNFVRDFLADTKPMSASSGSWLSKARSQTGMVKDLTNVTQGVRKAELNLVKTQNKKNVTETEIDMAQSSLDVAQSTEFELDRVYWAAIADAYQSIKDSLSGKKDAAGAVAKSMQIFCIGQDFSKIEASIDEPDWFNTGAAGNVLKFNKSNGIIPLLHLLGGLSTDVITGYQMDRPSYLAQGDSNYKTKALLNHSRRCFAYKKLGSFSKDELYKITNTSMALKNNEASIKGYLNSWTYFKPFLILNNAEEPPEPVRSSDFVADAKERENIRKGLKEFNGVSIQDCANSQYVGQCLCSCEAAGLTWDDLLSDNDDGTGHLNKGIGFEGYITQLAGGIPVDSMALSGQLANEFIQTVYNYPGDWREFICDFRPEWIVSTKGYFADGSTNVVQDRLADSFFYKGLLALKPAQALGNKLESLLPYYNAVQSQSIITPDEELFGSNEPDLDSSDNNTNELNSYQQPMNQNNFNPTSVVQTGWQNNANLMEHAFDDESEGRFVENDEELEEFEDIYADEQVSPQVQVEDKWSESQRRAEAERLVTVFLAGVQIGDPAKAAKLSNPNLHDALVKMVYGILLQKGY